MKDTWILDVLADLKTFADANSLPFLAESLEDARNLAAIELAVRDADGGGVAPVRGRRHAHRSRALALVQAGPAVKRVGS